MGTAKLLTEDEVVETLVSQLEKEGYKMESHSKGTQPGHDIEGKTPDGRDFYIECKGSVSPNDGSDFGTHGKWPRAAEAVFKQLRLKAEKPDAEVGIAFPDDPYYKQTLMGILIESGMMEKLDIKLYWVSKS